MALITHLPLYCLPELAWFRQLPEKSVVQIVNYAAFPDDHRFKRIDFAGQQGRQQFTIPLVSDSRHSDYKSVKISYQTNWHHQLINALQTAYGKSPFYEYYDYRLNPIFKKAPTFLYDLNMELLHFMLKAFKLDLSIKETDLGDYIAPELNIGNLPYYQVFHDRNGFIEQLSALDFLFNEGWENL
jgi:hypothetical protein